MKSTRVYVAVVHYKNAEWIDLQNKYLHRFMSEEHELFACLEGIDKSHFDKFHLAVDYRAKNRQASYNHAEKLNFLAGKMLESADDQDVIIFMDSDAFPIKDLMGYVRDRLRSFPLIAVRRDENDGDVQPHPCFCATTAGFWRTIQGDWMPGYSWKNGIGRTVTDVGGNLLEILNNQGVTWYPMLRSNRRNLHPIFFAVYDGMIYHHGAGSRVPVTRCDYSKCISRNPFVYHYRLMKMKATNRRLKRDILRKIQAGEDFYEHLT